MRTAAILRVGALPKDEHFIFPKVKRSLWFAKKSMITWYWPPLFGTISILHIPYAEAH